MNRHRHHTIYHHQSDDGYIEIKQQGSTRSLFFGNDTKQSEIDLSQPHRLQLSYTQTMTSALLLCPTPNRVLMLGLGAGALVNFIYHHYPHCQIDVVEKRQDVVNLAFSHFALPLDKRIKISVDDGLSLLQQSHSSNYDIIFVDAYTHEGVADIVKTKPLFQEAKRCLCQNGVVSINLWNNSSQAYMRSLQQIDEVFSHQVLTLQVEEKANVTVLASNCTLPKQLKTLRPIATELSARTNMDFHYFIKQLNELGFRYKLMKWMASSI